VVISAIGDNQQDLAGVPRFSHLPQTQIDRIQQRGVPPGLGRGHPVLNLLGRAGEAHRQFRPVPELDQAKLVLRIGAFEKLGHGLLQLAEPWRHAAAEIQHQPDRNWGLFRREIGHCLRGFFFEHLKVLP
jgi:hypothetical protein